MRVLIYKPIDYPQPIGGPAGYLFNLREGLKAIDNQDVEIDYLPGRKSDNRIKAMLKQNPIISWVISTNAYKAIKQYIWVKKLINRHEYCSSDISQYDVIHFHTTLDMYMMREDLSKYCGKVILTSHSPIPFFRELIDKMSIIGWADPFIEAKLEKIDRYAFERADSIILPCGYSDESYADMWAAYAEIKEKRNDKYLYMLTGVCEKNVTCSRQEFRRRWNVPEDAFVIGYVGRHNKTKGYDRLLQLGEKLLNYNSKLYFLVGGDETPLKGMDHNRWIETGWLGNPQDLLNSVDLFMLPNKSTYFDLVLLEAISLGTPVIASNSGGNKLFQGEQGIRLFDDDKSLFYEVENVMKMSASELEQLREKNTDLYKSFFTEKKFAEQYIKLLHRLTDNFGRD